MNKLKESREFQMLKNNISSSFVKSDYSKVEKKLSSKNKENAKSLLDCSQRTILHNIRPTKSQIQKPPRERVRSMLHNNTGLNKQDISMSSLLTLDQRQSHKVRPQQYDKRNLESCSVILEKLDTSQLPQGIQQIQRNNPPSHFNSSFVVNNLNPSVLDSFSVYSLHQPQIRHRQNPVAPLNLERSQSGFLRPVSSTLDDIKLALMNEKKEELIETLNEFRLSPYIDYVRKLYLYEKLEETLYRIMQKHVMQQQTQSFHQSEWQMEPNKFQHIQNWMEKTQRETEGQGHVEPSPEAQSETQIIPPIPQETGDQSFQELVSEESQSLVQHQEVRQGTYCLGDWTVLKGDGPSDLKVAGILIHVIFRNTIVQHHVSHNVIEVPKKNIIKTNTCTYFLKGNLVDPTNSIPQKIKKYFMQGGFPENWKSVAKNWDNLYENKQNKMLRQNQLPANNMNLNNTKLEVQDKRNDNILCTPKNSNIRNNIITRSVARKEKMRRLGLFGKLVI